MNGIKCQFYQTNDNDNLSGEAVARLWIITMLIRRFNCLIWWFRFRTRTSSLKTKRKCGRNAMVWNQLLKCWYADQQNVFVLAWEDQRMVWRYLIMFLQHCVINGNDGRSYRTRSTRKFVGTSRLTMLWMRI